MDDRLAKKAFLLGGTLHKASVVKFMDSGHFVLDVNDNVEKLSSEVADMREIVEKLTAYWKVHHGDPVEGRRFLPGDVVAVEMGSWRPALVTEFQYVKGVHSYELLLLDCGQMVEVHRMQFRDIPPNITLKSRYTFFYLIDLLPVEVKKRSNGQWSVNSCNELISMIDIASSISIIITAKQNKCGYVRLFGIMYLHILAQILNVRKYLLDQNEAFEDHALFKQYYGLTDDDYFHQLSEEGVEQKPPIVIPPMKLEKITDETLDEYLPPAWRIGGTDPIPQVEREDCRRRLNNEALISFGVPLAVSSKEQPETSESQCSNQVDKPCHDCPTSESDGHHRRLMMGRDIDFSRLHNCGEDNPISQNRKFKPETPKNKPFLEEDEHCVLSESLPERIQRSLMVEKQTSFARVYNPDKEISVDRQDIKFKDSEEYQNVHFKEKTTNLCKSMGNPRKQMSEKAVSKDLDGKERMSRRTKLVLPAEEHNLFNEKSENLPEVQVITGELSERLQAWLKCSKPKSALKAGTSYSSHDRRSSTDIQCEERGAQEGGKPTSLKSSSQHIDCNVPEVKTHQRELSKKFTKLLGSSDDDARFMKRHVPLHNSMNEFQGEAVKERSKDQEPSFNAEPNETRFINNIQVLSEEDKAIILAAFKAPNPKY